MKEQAGVRLNKATPQTRRTTRRKLPKPDNGLKVIVTMGPSYEPIDKVRRITNMSTGRLGGMIANALAFEGYQVTAFVSEAASWKGELNAKEEFTFSTNESLKLALEDYASKNTAYAVLHVAALSDFQIKRILDYENQEIDSQKIPSAEKDLKLILKPAPKLIRNLRNWFPDAKLIGWKYEMVGKRQDTLVKGWQQITNNNTNACVVNGEAYGDGFGFCTPHNGIKKLADEEGLISYLKEFLEVQASTTPTPSSFETTSDS